MIHYVLGHGGSGKTFYCLNRFRTLSKARFFASLGHENDLKMTKGLKSGLIDIGPSYRENLDNKPVFEKIMEEAVKKAIDEHVQTIFLDEFQLYCTKTLTDLILKSENDFYIIHQFPRQIPLDLFAAIWNKSEKKYLLDPYQPSEFYKV